LSNQAINADTVDKLVADAKQKLAEKRAEKMSKEKNAKQAEAKWMEKMDWFKQTDLEQRVSLINSAAN